MKLCLVFVLLNIREMFVFFVFEDKHASFDVCTNCYKKSRACIYDCKHLDGIGISLTVYTTSCSYLSVDLILRGKSSLKINFQKEKIHVLRISARWKNYFCDALM
jgi:hypothetical protein